MIVIVQERKKHWCFSMGPENFHIFSHSMGVCLFVYFYLFIFLLFWLFILFNLYFSRGGGSLAFPVLPFWKRRHGKIFPFFLFERGDMRKVTIIQSLKNLSIDSCSSIIKLKNGLLFSMEFLETLRAFIIEIMRGIHR